MDSLKTLILAAIIGSLSAFPVSALADYYSRGMDAFIKHDDATALNYFALAAKQGHAKAQDKLGYMYRHGKGVPEDYKIALKWFTLAADQGHTGAQFSLGFMYRKGLGTIQDYTRAHMWWNIAASLGNEVARDYRDELQGIMTSIQIHEAQKLARECVTKNYKGC